MKHTYTDIMTDAIGKIITNKLKQAKTEEEKQKILEKLDTEFFSNLIDKSISAASKPILKEMKQTMYEHVLDFRAQEDEFFAIQKQKWNRAFSASEALYVMIIEFIDDYKAYVEDLDKVLFDNKKWTYLAMRYIHGRAMQVYLEIVTLMKNGFADGAYARWRTLYELAVVCDFISIYGEDTAKSFHQSSESDERYYNWAKASGAFSSSQRNITFHILEQKTNLNKESWAKEYQLANLTVHASPQGTFKRLGNPKERNSDIIPIGHTDYGLVLPGVNAAVSLVQTTIMFGSLFVDADILLFEKIMYEWIEVVNEKYEECNKEIFAETENNSAEKT